MRTAARNLVELLEPRRLFNAGSVLFIRGAERSGGFLEQQTDFSFTEQLAGIDNTNANAGNHGWSTFAQALRDAGYTVNQAVEPLESNAPSTGQTAGAPLDLAALNLSQYKVVVFASNNASYSSAQVDILENYVRAGGSALFISDANFGGNWADASNSDQPFLSRFGVTVYQDNGTYALNRNQNDFLVADHPIFAGVNSFDGEGVSPFFVSNSNVPGVSISLLARAKQQVRLNSPPFGDRQIGNTRAAAATDASLIVGTVGSGRIAGHFDRNTFFNAGGAGTDITRLDNRRFAINLFDWLSRRNEQPPADVTPPRVTPKSFTLDTLQRATFESNESLRTSFTASRISLNNLSTGQLVSASLYAISISRRVVTVTFNTILPAGHYRLTLNTGSVRDLAGNNLSQAASLQFFSLPGDVNFDRRVDAQDLLILARNFGRSSNVTWTQGDLNLDGRVDRQDVALLNESWGQWVVAGGQ
jgi:Dockerin type I domain/Bacterial Ig-like domain